MHIRQIALVGRELEPVVDELRAVFGLEVAFHDPGVEVFGLRNAVLPVGQTFLEVVSPVRDDTTAGRFLARRGGDGGYMVIFQTTDLEGDRRRLSALGVRTVWEITLDDIATVHLHPRDVGGAIVSLDEPRPAASWHWAGPTWQAHVRTEVVRALTSVTIGAADPTDMARRWAEVLGLFRTPVETPRDAAPAKTTRHDTALEKAPTITLPLDPGEVRFVPAGSRGEGIEAIGLSAADPARTLALARERGLSVEGQSVTLAGVRFNLEPPA